MNNSCSVYNNFIFHIKYLCFENTKMLIFYYSYKFYIKHTTDSIEILEAYYGPMDELDWGWEDSPIYGGGNRLFTLNTPDGSVTTLEEGYYDLSPGGVIPDGQNLDLTYSVDLSGESDYSFGNNINFPPKFQ